MTKKKIYFLAIFTALALAQLYVPLSLAWQWENVLQNGQAFYLETAPVDPYDAFRGRYISLNFKENKAPFNDALPASLEYGQTVYAVLETTAGRQAAFIKEISVQKPVNKPYVKTRFNGFDSKIPPVVEVVFPFNRYYLPEEFALSAEKELARRSRQSKNKKKAVALVRIQDGYGVIENIYVDDKPLLKYLKEQKEGS
jgi:uncharacterized membrane-anchored protein